LIKCLWLSTDYGLQTTETDKIKKSRRSGKEVKRLRKDYRLLARKVV